MDNFYKAALLIGLEKIKIGSLSMPTLRSNEVLVKIKHASLCPTDLKKYYHLDENSRRALSDSNPIVLGHEAAGVVEEIGSDVSTFQPGQRVAVDPMLPCGSCAYCLTKDYPMCQNLLGIGASAGSVISSIELLKENGIGGCFAEYLKLPESNLFLLPDSIDLEAAVLMEPLADVIHSIEAGDPREFETAVVFGLGAMGLMHIRVLAHRGVKRIVGIDLLPERRKMAEQFGATTTLDPKRIDPVSELKKVNQGTGPEVIFVCTGGEAQKLTTNQALKSIRKGGRILLYASALKPAEIPVDINHIHYGMIVLSGTVGFYHRHALQALQLLENGVIEAGKIRRPVYSLDEVQDAFKIYGNPEVVKVGIDIG